MIFNTFQDTDIVTGRTTRVASGFWPGGVTNWSQSLFVDDLWDLTGSIATPSPAYGTSLYDVRRTMYYVNVFPNATYHEQHDPYFSATYGHIAGSGSFNIETSSILVNPTKAIYTQYKNLLLGTGDVDGKFSFKIGSAGGTTNANDIFVLTFSTYKMKDRLDEWIFQISFSGSYGCKTYIDDSITDTQVKTVYNLISGSLESGVAPNATYDGVGLFYPNNGMLVINAQKLDDIIGMQASTTVNYNSDGGGKYYYSSASFSTDYSQNSKVIVEAIKAAGSNTSIQMKIRKSEYVPARHYFIRIKNRDFNYSNNPTYVYDGTDGNHANGTIRNSDFVDNPRTYLTTIGLYNSDNELVAVAKLSRPAVKTFDNEILCKVRIDT